MLDALTTAAWHLGMKMYISKIIKFIVEMFFRVEFVCFATVLGASAILVI